MAFFLDFNSDEELLKVFNTNVFGPLRLIRAILPWMRSYGHGTIANICGIGGMNGAPNAGIYCSSKAAFASITEALQRETDGLGINVCLVQLGHFRTSFLQPGHRIKVENPIADYSPILAPIQKAFDGLNGNQQGDPSKAAAVIADALTSSKGSFPSLLPVGPDVPKAELQTHTARLDKMLECNIYTGITDINENKSN